MMPIETQKSHWRLFLYYNFFRIAIGIFFLAQTYSSVVLTARSAISPYSFAALGVNVYAASAIVAIFTALFLRRFFQVQTALCALIDVVFLCLMMYRVDGVDSGIGILMMLSLLTASFLSSSQQWAQFYGMCAVIGVLSLQIMGTMELRFSPISLPHAVILASGLFLIASIAQNFGRRTFENEQLAQQRSRERDNQILINQTIVEQMPSGVVIVDKENRVLLQNPEAFALLGAQKGTLLTPALNEMLERWRNHHEPPEVEDENFHPRSGEFLVKNVHGQDLLARFEESNSTSGESLVFLENLSRMKEQAQQMKLASLGRLTASIAHEIRNPLSAIKHAGELLAEENPEEIKKRLLRIINDNVARLDRIVADVLDLGRKTQSSPEVIPLDEFCRRAIEQICLTEKILPEVVELSAIAVSIFFDRSHLERVVWNLLTNALRYSTRQSRAVRVWLALSEDERFVELHVLDDGPGVADENREKIFEPFFTTAQQGTGLGLFITRELCNANGAHLDLIPKDNEGGAHFIMTGRRESGS